MYTLYRTLRTHGHKNRRLDYPVIEVVNEILPKDKPRYLMGVGTPINLLEGIERGIDMFDCIMPTRNGRNGQLFTRFGTINMRNKKWIEAICKPSISFALIKWCR